MGAGLWAGVMMGTLTWLTAAVPAAYVAQPQVALRKAPDEHAPVRKTLRLNTPVTVVKERGNWRQVKAAGVTGFVPAAALSPTRLTVESLLEGVEKAPAAAQSARLWNAVTLAPQRVDLWERLVALGRTAGDTRGVERAQQGLWDARARDGSWDDVGGVAADGHALWPQACVDVAPGSSSPALPPDSGPPPSWPADAWLLTTEGAMDPQAGPPTCFHGVWAVHVASEAPGLWLPRALLPDTVDTFSAAPEKSAPACGSGYSICKTYSAHDGAFLVQLGARTWTGEEEDTHADGLVEGAARVALRHGKTTRWSSWTAFPRTLQSTLPLPVALTQDAPHTFRLALWHAEGPCCEPRPSAWWMLLQEQGARLKVTTGAVASGPP